MTHIDTQMLKRPSRRPDRLAVYLVMLFILQGCWGALGNPAQAAEKDSVHGQSIMGDPREAFLNAPEYVKPGVFWM